MATSTEALIVEYASAPTPPSLPPSPLSPLSSPLPKIPSPPLLLSHLHTSHTYTSAPLGYRATMIQLRAASLTGEISESDIPRAPDRPFEKGHSLAHKVDYEFIDTLDASIRASWGRVMTAVEEVNERVTDLATTQR
ncbi:hypothetical protein Tco_0713202 [Tanacetum coccineum]